jgi:23S rRNA (uracil1939-C5)-methyltransferase
VSLEVGDVVELTAEKPVSGGRMIGRHDGEVILVAGAIPSEYVRARVTRAARRIAFADVVEILQPSKDRRDINTDPACGGCLYAHISYARQIELKGAIIADAFARIGRIPLQQAVPVHGSPEHAYRMRARFHVRDGRACFYREGSHETCDPRQTRQLTSSAVDAVDAALAPLVEARVNVTSAELSETIASDQRTIHFAVETSHGLSDPLARAVQAAQLTGATARTADGATASAGDPIVTDPLSALSEGRAANGVLRRHPAAFFQGNRFLIGSLVAAVLDSVPPGPVLDLYAGVGLFATALAATGRADLTAVEGDPISARDLERNASPFSGQLRVVHSSVEAFVRRAARPHTLIVDPPRTGMSKEAGEAIGRIAAPRLVSVSCDAPTMARDARRLLDSGYRLTALQAFDMFPNTPHVESLGVFER